MSYKSQLFPLSSTRETPLREEIDGSWGSSIASVREMNLMRSCLVYDSASETGFARRRSNWTSMLGLGLAAVVSASIWAGIGLIVANVWK